MERRRAEGWRSGLVRRLLGLAFLVAGSSASLAGVPTEGDLDVISYKIDVVIEDERIVETVEMAISSRKAVRELALELASSVELRSCTLDGKDVPFEHSKWDLTLDLAAVGSPKGDFVLQFELDGKPHNNQRGKYLRTVISPERSYIRSQYAWYPRRKADMAVYETNLSVQPGWTARTAGDLQGNVEKGGRVVWHYLLEKATDTIGFAAGEYISVKRETKTGLSLDALVLAGHEAGAKHLLDVAKQSIDFFGALLGPMSEQHFTLVEMPSAFGSGSGYGETGYALIGSGAFEDAASAPWASSLITHEVAHTWWGREVVFSNFASEMLATYCTLRFTEEAQGGEAARAMRRKFVARVGSIAEQKGLIALDSIVGFGSSDPAVYSVCAYDKAAMLLHILEREMGREDFDAALKELFQESRDQIIAYADVKRGLQGKRHKSIFSQWERAELPELSLEFETTKSGKSHKVTGTLLQAGVERPFKMQVTLRAVAGDLSADHVIKVKKASTKFKFKSDFAPESILIDPDKHLLTTRAALADVEALTKAIFDVANASSAKDPEALRRTIKNARKVIEAGQEKDAHFYTAIGRCQFRLGELDEAKDTFAIALKGGAGGPFHRAWVHLRLGCIADLQGNRKAAKASYEKVLSGDPSKYRTQRNLAEKYLKQAFRGLDKDS